MSVKPPTGSGRVRLVEIEGIDLQPCGGTHVARTGEIGHAEVTGIEKKGKINRRVRIALAPCKRIETPCPLATSSPRLNSRPSLAMPISA